MMGIACLVHRGRAEWRWGSWRPELKLWMRGCRSQWVPTLSQTRVWSLSFSQPSLPSSFPSSICSHGMTGEHMVIINPLSSPMVKTTQKRTIYTTFIYSAEALSNCSSGKNLTHCFSEEDGHWLQRRGLLKSMLCWKLDVAINYSVVKLNLVCFRCYRLKRLYNFNMNWCRI